MASRISPPLAVSPETSADGYKEVQGSAVDYAKDGFDLLILRIMLQVISADLGL